MTTLNTTNFNYNQKVTDLENAFSIYEDGKNNFVFNLNETVYVNVPQSYLKQYIPDHPLHWSTISHKLYGTTRLAWLLMKLNNVKADRLFTRVLPTQVVYYLDESDVQQLLSTMEGS